MLQHCSPFFVIVYLMFVLVQSSAQNWDQCRLREVKLHLCTRGQYTNVTSPPEQVNEKVRDMARDMGHRLRLGETEKNQLESTLSQLSNIIA